MNDDRDRRWAGSLMRTASAGLILMASATAALATTEAEALALCETAMRQTYGATDLRDVEFRRHHEIPYVYGTADFADVAAVHYRCRLYQEQVTSVRYLVGDPNQNEDQAWAEARPTPATHAVGAFPEAAKTMPSPPPEVEPHFEKVPASN
jgi:hypothetical protein